MLETGATLRIRFICFCPRAHLAAYTPSIEKSRPVLQGLLAIDHLTKEVSFN
ncbi:hypothetical protein HN51_065917 [Arachis hypogaea]